MKKEALFIVRFFQYSKAGALAFIAVVFLFAVINFKQGAVATPLYELGMFSGVFHLQDTQTVYRININHEPLDWSTVDVAKRDQLIFSIIHYQKTQFQNAAIYHTMKNSLGRFGWGSFMREDAFTAVASPAQFAQWYKALVGRLTNRDVQHLEVFTQSYSWQQQQFIPVDSVQQITFLATP